LYLKRRKGKMEKDTQVTENDIQTVEEPQILEEIVVEELSIDGVCGVY
jgi:mycofactocin precursor